MKPSLAVLALLLALPGQDPQKTSFAVLSGFDYLEGKPLPAEVRILDQKIVTLSGAMRREVPGSHPVDQFLLVNDACGCTGTPKLNEIVYCAMPEGQTTEIKPGIVTLTGKLYVGERKEDGVVWAVYLMDVEKLQ